jgi:hypothetical protein
MATKTSAFVLAAALTGCVGGGFEYSDGYYSAGVSVASPDLVAIGPGISVVADANYPIFYTDNAYWLYRDNYWYRSPYYSGGWVRYTAPPIVLRSIERPYAYAHYRRGYAARAYNRGYYDRRYYDRGYYGRTYPRTYQRTYPRTYPQTYQRTYPPGYQRNYQRTYPQGYQRTYPQGRTYQRTQPQQYRQVQRAPVQRGTPQARDRRDRDRDRR